MGRVDDLRARMNHELAVAQLEDDLVGLKEAGADPDVVRDTKLRLREARQAFRHQREKAAAATPPTLETTSAVTTMPGGTS